MKKYPHGGIDKRYINDVILNKNNDIKYIEHHSERSEGTLKGSAKLIPCKLKRCKLKVMNSIAQLQEMASPLWG